MGGVLSKFFARGAYFAKSPCLGSEDLTSAPGVCSRLELIDALQSIIKGRYFGSLFTIVTKKYVYYVMVSMSMEFIFHALIAMMNSNM